MIESMSFTIVPGLTNLPPGLGVVSERDFVTAGTANAALTCRREVTLWCEDGVSLAGTWIEPLGEARAVAVINSATGVRRGYYKAFAEWLARHGYATLTYDYRGIGDSLGGSIRESSATMLEWGRQDIPAALQAALARSKPLLIVGHSSGGNLLSMAPGHEQAAAIVVVGSQLADWRYWNGLQRVGIMAYFRMISVLSAICGYLPAWALGGGNAAALPQGVAGQWARWGSTPGYYFGAPEAADLPRPEAFRGSYHAYSISDDLYAPPRAVEALVGRHTASRATLFALKPRSLGVEAIGHFGAFRRHPGGKLWPHLLERIEAETPELRTRTEHHR